MDPTYWGLPKYSKRTTNPSSEDGGNTEKPVVEEPVVESPAGNYIGKDLINMYTMPDSLAGWAGQ